VNDVEQKKQALEELVGEILASGRKGIVITGDVSKDNEVQAMVKKTVEELGGLDIVCSFLIVLSDSYDNAWIDGRECRDSPSPRYT
jgi:enoyl-[acyl-carrier-protein] reductase (NADH)